MEIAAADEESGSSAGDFQEEVREKFGLRAVNEEAKILERLKEIRANFYNRLSSQKLIKNTKGRIPFSEHMTISKRASLPSSSFVLLQRATIRW